MQKKKLHNLVDFLKNVVKITEKEVIKEVKSGILQGVIEDMNTNQLSKGYGSDGMKLPDYSDVSVQMFGKKPGSMTMKDSGDFYESIELKMKKNTITLISNDYKMKPPIQLDWAYGPLLGLAKKNQLNLAKDYLIPEAIFSIKKQIKKI